MKKFFSQRKKRHMRLRRRVIGTSERPRMYVKRSLKHLYVQFVDDITGKTLTGISTLSKEFKENNKDSKCNKDTAKELGQIAGKLALDRNIKKIVFDRGGYKFHGKIKAIADGAREAGLNF